MFTLDSYTPDTRYSDKSKGYLYRGSLGGYPCQVHIEHTKIKTDNRTHHQDGQPINPEDGAYINAYITLPQTCPTYNQEDDTYTTAIHHIQWSVITDAMVCASLVPAGCMIPCPDHLDDPDHLRIVQETLHRFIQHVNNPIHAQHHRTLVRGIVAWVLNTHVTTIEDLIKDTFVFKILFDPINNSGVYDMFIEYRDCSNTEYSVVRIGRVDHQVYTTYNQQTGQHDSRTIPGIIIDQCVAPARSIFNAIRNMHIEGLDTQHGRMMAIQAMQPLIDMNTDTH